jgi:hypothetical protein
VIIDDFDFMDMVILPSEADSILIVDAYAVLADTVALQSLQPVSRWIQQIVQARGPMVRSQFALNDVLQLRIFSTTRAIEYLLCFTICEAHNHSASISRTTLYAQRSTRLEPCIPASSLNSKPYSP